MPSVYAFYFVRFAPVLSPEAFILFYFSINLRPIVTIPPPLSSSIQRYLVQFLTMAETFSILTKYKALCGSHKSICVLLVSGIVRIFLCGQSLGECVAFCGDEVLLLSHSRPHRLDFGGPPPSNLYPLELG